MTIIKCENRSCIFYVNGLCSAKEINVKNCVNNKLYFKEKWE